MLNKKQEFGLEMYEKGYKKATSDILERLNEFKSQMDYEIDFCNKAGVIPSIHPRRVKQWIDKIFAEELKQKIQGVKGE
ncbi:MAG: hypothetical protein KKD48_04405 [Nanoarchaeota archaeon]|nr:hypothetical protein [Nanoarchaeota archaeon]